MLNPQAACLDVSGLVIYAATGGAAQALEGLAGVEGLTVHAASAEGKIVATLETPDAQRSMELFERIGMKTADPKFDKAGNFIGSSHCYCSARDFARFGYLYLRNGVWDGERILPAGWVDYCRTATPQSDGTYGAHFWTIPGSLGLFYCSGMGGQRILMSPKLDLVVVRVGRTAPHKVAAAGVEATDRIVGGYGVELEGPES